MRTWRVFAQTVTFVVVNALRKISTLKELNLNDNKNRSESLGLVVASVVNLWKDYH